MKKQRKHGEVTVSWVEEKNSWYFRVQVDGKRIKKSTGVHAHTAIGKAAALAKAKDIAAALLGEDEQRLAAVVKRPGFATCGEVLDVYALHGPAASKTKTKSRFAAYAREVLGREAWQNASTHLVLTASALRKWIDMQKRAGRSESGIHTDVQTIKSVVARKRFHLFADLKLPDLTEFYSVSGGSTRTEGYQPIDRVALARMDRAARVPLRRRDARVRAALEEGEYVIPRTSPTDAYNVTHYGINEFVRQFIPDGEKGAYNLRKEYGAALPGAMA